MSDIALSPPSIAIVGSENEKTLDNKKEVRFPQFTTKRGLAFAGAMILLIISSYIGKVDNSKPIIVPASDPNNTFVQQANNQVIQTVVNESVVPEMQDTYKSLTEQAAAAYNEGRYCDYSTALYEEAKIIANNPDATSTDLWRAYGTIQQALGPNPFDQDLQLLMIDIMARLGQDTSTREIYLKDSIAIQSSCEQ